MCDYPDFGLRAFVLQKRKCPGRLRFRHHFSGKITDQKAIIKEMGTSFYIIEEGNIDTRHLPCNLEKEFRVNNLPVTLSGKVRVASRPSPGPCCTDFLVITSIKR